MLLRWEFLPRLLKAFKNYIYYSINIILNIKVITVYLNITIMYCFMFMLIHVFVIFRNK